MFIWLNINFHVYFVLDSAQYLNTYPYILTSVGINVHNLSFL